MTRYYAAQRTFWVDPVSGTIVKKKEHGYHYYAREPLKPEVTFVDFTVTSNEETVESQVANARDERDRLALWGRILPITFTAIGLVALVGGALLGSFSLRAESALIDPGLDEADHRFFGHAGPTKVRGRGARPRRCPLPTIRSAPDRPSDRASYRRGRFSRRPTRWCSADCDGALLAPGYLLLRDAVSTPRSFLPIRRWGFRRRRRGPAAGLRRRAGLWADRRRGGGQNAPGGRAVPRGLGRGSADGDGGARGRHGRSVRGGDDHRLESVCRRTTSAGALEPAGGLRLFAVGGGGDAAVADIRAAGRSDVCALVFWIALAGLTPTGLMLAATVAVALRFRVGFRPAAVVVHGGRPRCRGAGGAALAGRGGGFRFVVVLHRPKVCAHSPYAPSPASAHWAAWPASVESGMLMLYQPRAQHFSWSSRRLCCSARWLSDCPPWCADPSRRRC